MVSEPQAEVHPKTVRAVTKVVSAAKLAAAELGTTSTNLRNAALLAIAEALERNQQELLLANAEDVEMAQRKEAPESAVESLRLTPEAIVAAIDGVRRVAAVADPVGEVVEGRTLPNGIRLARVRIAMGVIGAICDQRARSGLEVAVIALKAGNAAVLYADGLARSTNTLLVELLRGAVGTAGLPADSVVSVDPWGPDGARALLAARDYVDLLIPRGDEALVSAVVRDSVVPVIETGPGIVHIYIDASAPVRMSTNIVLNSKTQDPSAVNAVETLLVHERAAKRVLPRLLGRLNQAGVVLRGGQDVGELAPEGVTVKRVARRDWAKEYLGAELAVKIVGGLDEAIDHIRSYSTGHTEVIVTNDTGNADTFTEAVDAAAVGVNVSTRFTDGGEYGMGCEAGVSTQRLHARGPLGPRVLTTSKWIMRGSGQIR